MNLVPKTFTVLYNKQLKLYYFLDRAIPSTGPENSYAAVWPCAWLLKTDEFSKNNVLLADINVGFVLSCTHVVPKLELLINAGLTIEQAFTMYRDILKENHIPDVSSNIPN